MSTEKTVRLTATVRQIYGLRLLLPGDEFSVNERVAKALVRMHFAAPVAEEEEKPKRRQYQRRDMTAEGTE